MFAVDRTYVADTSVDHYHADRQRVGADCAGMATENAMAETSTSLEIVVLGSGTSHGVPMIGCDCAVCRSPDPHDKRTRPSIVIRVGDRQNPLGGLCLLIDTTPELRVQCLANAIKSVDAVLLTHHHADHVAGMDDVRRFNWINKRSVPVYGTERTLANIKRMFHYAFEAAPDSPHSRPQIELNTIDAKPFSIRIDKVGLPTDKAGLPAVSITPIPLMHGPLPVLGFRVGRFAYCTDCSHVPDASVDLLGGLDALILDALRHKPHPAHFSLDEAVAMAERIGAKQTYFTHIAHGMAHEETNRSLPAGMALAHDGLRIKLPPRD